MSTWTSRSLRRASLWAACLALAACGGGIGLGGLGGGGPSQPAPERIAVTSDQVVVAGPDGYCVDPTATSDRDDTGFVLLGNCAAISNSRRALQPTSPAVLTAAISAPAEAGNIAENMGALDGFFRSEEGLALLSRSGEASSVTVLETAVQGDTFFLRAIDTSESQIDGVQGTYWRAYMDVGSRIATLTVLPVLDRDMASSEARQTLRGFTDAVRAANAGGPGVAPQTAVPAAGTPLPATPAAPAAPRPSGPETLPLQQSPLRDVGLFRRIFG